MSVRVCDIEFVVFTDCESCTGPLSTNPESIKAGKYGLKGGTCFAARRLEVVAFAGLLHLSWCVVGGVNFVFFFFRLFFSSNAHGLLQVRGHLLPNLNIYL